MVQHIDAHGFFGFHYCLPSSFAYDASPCQSAQTEAQSLSGQFPCMHPVTIVSAYYPLNHSKHSLREYTEWIAAFLPYVSAPIVLYSPPGEALNQIRELRGDLPMTVKVRQLFNKMQTSRRLSFIAPPYTFPNAHW